jgi:putative sterol carrier protein
MASLSDITEKIRAAVGADSGLGKSLKFDLKDAGVIHIDGGSVTNEDKPADLTLTLSKDDLLDIAAGRLDPTAAVMGGRIKLSDMMLAMSLQPKMGALFSKLG